MLSIFTLLSESVINSGFSQALVQRSKKLTKVDSSTIFFVNILWGLLIYIVLFFSAPYIAKFYEQVELLLLSRVLFFIIIVNCLGVVSRSMLIINMDFKSQAISGLVATLVSAPIGLYLVVKGASYWSLVWMMLVKAIIQNLCMWRLSRWNPIITFSVKSFKSLFGFGSKLMISGLISTFVNNLYVVMIGKYYSVSSVGYFTQSTTLTNYLSQLVASVLQGVSFPILTSIQEDKIKLSETYKKLLSITMLTSFPCLIGFASISESFVLLILGKSWLPSVPVIQILCLARAFTPVAAMNMSLLNAIGRSDLFLKIDMIKIPFVLFSLFLSIPFGIEVVAWALFFNVVISFFINTYYPGQLYGLGAITQLKYAFNYLFASFIMFLVVINIDFQSPLLNVIFGVFFGVVVYLLMLFLLKDKLFMGAVINIMKKVLR